MTDITCATTREALPALARGELDADAAGTVRAHLAGCDACAAEAELTALLAGSRMEPPAGLAERIQAAVRDRAETPPVHDARRPAWALAAAAVAALALGIGMPRGAPEPSADFPVDTDVAWFSDDGLVAGAPALDDLTDDALAALLEELES